MMECKELNTDNKIFKPILFNTAMEQAILNGRKTVTRRLVKEPYFIDESGMPMTMRSAPKGSKLYKAIGAMPYPETPYKVGDVLWVRKKFNNIETTSVLYAADDDFINFGYKTVDGYMFAESEIKWRPSIHMPREAARIFLKVADVRVERLQDIDKFWSSYEKEGMRNKNENISIEMKERFIDIWNSTIKKNELELFGWDANPWVFVYEFERCKNAV